MRVVVECMHRAEIIEGNGYIVLQSYIEGNRYDGTVNSKINYPPKGVYLPISQLHSILVVANLLAHNNITINYYIHLNSLRLKIEYSFEMGK